MCVWKRHRESVKRATDAVLSPRLCYTSCLLNSIGGCWHSKLLSAPGAPPPFAKGHAVFYGHREIRAVILFSTHTGHTRTCTHTDRWWRQSSRRSRRRRGRRSRATTARCSSSRSSCWPPQACSRMSRLPAALPAVGPRRRRGWRRQSTSWKGAEQEKEAECCRSLACCGCRLAAPRVPHVHPSLKHI